MIRRGCLHRPFCALAMVAILLLVGLPTFGRLHVAGQVTGPDATPALQYLCTALGMRILGVVPLPEADARQLHGAWSGAVAGDFRPQGTARHGAAGDDGGHHEHTDCDYCPLLLGLLACVVPGLLVTVLNGVGPAFVLRHRRNGRQRHPCGLGSRGPPALTW